MPIRNDLLIISRTRVNLQKTQGKVRGRLVVKNPLRCCATKWWRSEDIDRGRDSPDVMAASSNGRQCNRYTFYSESQSAKQRQTVPISPVELCNMKAYLMKQSYKTRTGNSILKSQKTRSSETISYWTRKTLRRLREDMLNWSREPQGWARWDKNTIGWNKNKDSKMGETAIKLHMQHKY